MTNVNRTSSKTLIIKNFQDSNKGEVKVTNLTGDETFVDLKLAISDQIGVEMNLINLNYNDEIIRDENEYIGEWNIKEFDCIKYLVVNLNRNDRYIKIKHYYCKNTFVFQIKVTETVSQICQNWIYRRRFRRDCIAFLYDDKKQMLDPDKTLEDNGGYKDIEYNVVLVYTFNNIYLTQYFVEITPYPDDQIPDIISRLKYHTDCNDDGIEMITYYNHHRLDKDTSLTEFGVDLEMPLIFEVYIRKLVFKFSHNGSIIKALKPLYPVRSTTKNKDLIRFVDREYGIKSPLKYFENFTEVEMESTMADVGVRKHEVAIGINGKIMDTNMETKFKYIIGDLRSVISKSYKTAFMSTSIDVSRIDKKYLNIVDLQNKSIKIEYGVGDFTNYLYRVVETIYRSESVKLLFHNEPLELNKSIECYRIGEDDILQCKEMKKFQIKITGIELVSDEISVDISIKLSDLLDQIILDKQSRGEVVVMVNGKYYEESEYLYNIRNIEESVIKITKQNMKLTLEFPEPIEITMNLYDTCSDIYEIALALQMSLMEIDDEIILDNLFIYHNFPHIIRSDLTLLQLQICDGFRFQVRYKTQVDMSESENEAQYENCKMFYKIHPNQNFKEIKYNIKGTGAEFADTVRKNYDFHSDVEIFDLYKNFVDPSNRVPFEEQFIFTKVNSKKLNLILPSGEPGEAFVDDRDSISSLKYILKQQFDEYKEGILYMRLFFQSRQLEDDKTIGYYGLRENDTIEIKPCTAQIRVKSENFEFYPVEIFGNESGGDLIQKIKNLTGISENINLIFSNEEYSRSRLLFDLNDEDIVEFEIIKDPNIIKMKDVSSAASPFLQSLPADQVENENFKKIEEDLLPTDGRSIIIIMKDNTRLTSTLPIRNEKFSELEYIKAEKIDTQNSGAIRDLDRGCFGAVQLYQDKEDSNTLYAMKRFLFDNDHKTVYLSLKRELQYTQVIGDNDYLVKAYNCSSDGQNIYIKMEYLPGGSLKSYIEKSPRKKLQEPEISKFSRDILQGLKYLHDRNILHRDIKCANVVLDDMDKAKLCDFGLVKLNLDCDRESFLEGFKQTHCGSLCYMAPEVMENEKYGPKADIYSFGITVIEMTTGKPPFVECQEEDMLRIKKTCKQITIKVKKITCNLRKFYEICTLPNPDERPTVDDLLEHDFLCDRN